MLVGAGPAAVLSFRVLGAAAEVITIAVVAPQLGCDGSALACAMAGRVHELEVPMPMARPGVATVRCEPGMGCVVTSLGAA
jgi:hypothetical protein